MTKNRALHLAIFEYHRRQEDQDAALRYLVETFWRHFKKESDLVHLEELLSDYVAAYRRGGCIGIKTRLRVALDAGEELQVTGEVPRLDLNPSGGYAAWFFGKGRYDWSGELRMPLLQRHLASKMKVPDEFVTIGFYYLETGEYEPRIYSTADIAAAQAELARMAEAIVAPF